MVVKKAGKLLYLYVITHEKRRHLATDASRSGTPIEIVSKVILRLVNLLTTKRRLGRINDTEAV
jgi:integrase/recombinase XerD